MTVYALLQAAAGILDVCTVVFSTTMLCTEYIHQAALWLLTRVIDTITGCHLQQWMRFVAASDTDIKNSTTAASRENPHMCPPTEMTVWQADWKHIVKKPSWEMGLSPQDWSNVLWHCRSSSGDPFSCYSWHAHLIAFRCHNNFPLIDAVKEHCPLKTIR